MLLTDTHIESVKWLQMKQLYVIQYLIILLFKKKFHPLVIQAEDHGRCNDTYSKNHTPHHTPISSWVHFGKVRHVQKYVKKYNWRN